jgi:dUTP pyrophosphatase
MTMFAAVEGKNPKRPTRAYKGDAGWDIYPLESFNLAPGQVLIIPTGLHVAVTPGYYGRLAPRSGYGSKGMHILAGVIDSGFRDELLVAIANVKFVDDRGLPNIQFLSFEPEKAFVQLVIEKIEEEDEYQWVDKLPPAVRGKRGFGSSDKECI